MAEHPVVKMSKSLGNVVNPDETIDEYGADTMRLYEMFIGDFEKSAAWSQKAIKGCRRFVERVWALLTRYSRAMNTARKMRLRCTARSRRSARTLKT